MRAPTGRHRPVDDITSAQLDRLAKNLIGQSPDELSNIVASNPELVREWMSELHQRRESLEAEVLALDAALHRLSNVGNKRRRSVA